MADPVRAGKPALTWNAWLRYDVVRRFLSEIGGRSLLEIGCGRGALGARLAERYIYVGYEPDVASFTTACARVGERGRVLDGFLPAQPDGAYDIVAAFEVLEHIEDDAAALRAWREWVRPGGHLLLSVPAHPGRFAAADRRVGHFRRYTRQGLASLFVSCGFREPVIRAYGFPLGYLLELGRNRLAEREAAGSMMERTADSGRWHQPTDRIEWLTRLGTAPFRLLQRPFAETALGTGWVALARRPT